MTLALHDLLVRERALVHEFIVLLESEASILGDDTALDALSDLTVRKEELARTLAVAGEARDQCLQSLGRDKGFDGMQAACDADGTLLEPWTSLLDAARRASELNRQNGALIDAHLAHTQASLKGLRQIQAGTPAVYDAYGKTQNAGVLRSIAAG